MHCPRCGSTHIRKNAKKQGKQNNICCGCHRQFIDAYEPKGYPDEIKRQCLEMYVNGMGFRAIERVTKVHHTTVINWVKQVSNSLPSAPEYSEIPEVAELDELQTFVGSKKTKFGARSAVNHSTSGILAWVIGDRSAETFIRLWKIAKCWQCYFYVTDGYKVYPCFIDDADQIVSKTYMTRVEGENTRLRHYLARLHRRTLCYSRVSRNARAFSSIVTTLPERAFYPPASHNHTLIQQRRYCNIIYVMLYWWSSLNPSFFASGGTKRVLFSLFHQKSGKFRT